MCPGWVIQHLHIYARTYAHTHSLSKVQWAVLRLIEWSVESCNDLLVRPTTVSNPKRLKLSYWLTLLGMTSFSVSQAGIIPGLGVGWLATKVEQWKWDFGTWYRFCCSSSCEATTVIHVVCTTHVPYVVSFFIEGEEGKKVLTMKSCANIIFLIIPFWCLDVILLTTVLCKMY